MTRLTEPKRWRAVIATKGGQTETHEVDEIEDLQEIVEAGPDWDDLSHITITYLLTLEA